MNLSSRLYTDKLQLFSWCDESHVRHERAERSRRKFEKKKTAAGGIIVNEIRRQERHIFHEEKKPAFLIIVKAYMESCAR